GLGLVGLRLAAQGESPVRSAGPAAPEKTADAHSEPLPPGAVLRLGTLQQRAVGAVLAVRADGKAGVGVRGGKGIRSWDAATGELGQKRGLPGEAWNNSLLSPEGRWLLRSAIGPEEQLEVRDVLTGKKVRNLAIKGSRYIGPVAFSSDGKRVAAVGHRR